MRSRALNVSFHDKKRSAQCDYRNKKNYAEQRYAAENNNYNLPVIDLAMYV